MEFDTQRLKNKFDTVMRKIILFTLVILSFSACRKHISEKDLTKLNGYWEIKKAITPNGETKNYETNTVVDYIKLDSKRAGLRKKVQVDLVGNMNTSDDAEKFEIQIVEAEWIILYKNANNQWEESLIELKDNEFTVRNTEGFEYQYVRWTPISTEKEP